ncbi:MAG TPA: ABC transporter [Clostridiales bacterium UBA8960]|nr:ABC transporter [Clostridiales bacterium UBA8960]
MTKLIRFLKPFTLLILLSIVLLYGQAQAELALPDYLSNIVNIGIQNSGIDDVKPEIFIAEDLNRILSLTSEAERRMILDAYPIKAVGDADYGTYLIKYPLIDGRSIAVLNVSEISDIPAFDLALSKALITAMSQMQGMPIDISAYDDTMQLQMGVKASSGYLESLGHDIEKTQRDYILRTGGKMLIISLLGAIASITVGLIAARVAAGMGRNLRKAVFTKVEQFSSAEFDKFSTASLITRTTNDITQIQTLMVMMVRMIFYAPLMGIGGVIRALDKSVPMSWIIAIAVIILLGLIMIVFSIAMPKFKAVQKLVDKLNLVVRENLTGMMVVRAFNTQSFEESRFERANDELTKTNLFVNRVMVFMFPVMMLIMNGVTLMIVWVGAHQIANSAMLVGDMMAFMQYAMQIIMSFLMLSMVFIMIPRASVSAGRVSEVLETELTILDPSEPVSFSDHPQGIVVFDNVSFRFPGAEEDLIKNVSFTAESGKTTAIIGSTGSGKSTLINLIPRFYDITGGNITIDGVDIRAVKQSELRKLIGYAPQKASLFSGTILSNLQFADASASDAQIGETLQVAQAADFVFEKPEGMNASIAQSGANVSGGQKQRLSIARALLRQPNILIFDDTFSALDYKTDVALRQALKQRVQKSTVILVAQRIATIKSADQILVLDEGRLVGSGTHSELMKRCKTYQEIALSQLSMEELA